MRGTRALRNIMDGIPYSSSAPSVLTPVSWGCYHWQLAWLEILARHAAADDASKPERDGIDITQHLGIGTVHAAIIVGHSFSTGAFPLIITHGRPPHLAATRLDRRSSGRCRNPASLRH